MFVEPDVADVYGEIQYARVEAPRVGKVGCVVAWTLLLVGLVAVPADATLQHTWGVAIVGLLSGLGLQWTFERAGGRLRRRREQWATYAWLAAALVLVRIGLAHVPLAITWIPLGAVLVPITWQLGRRVTIAAALVLALAVAAMPNPFDPVLALTLATQGLAIGLLTPRRRRSGWRWIGSIMLLTGAATLLGYVGAQLLIVGQLDHGDLAGLTQSRLAMAGFAGLASPLLALMIDPLFEAAVGNLSRSSLLELSDLNHPALQRISTRAPGTWAHSRAMANLAESAAHAVGADALLVRVGAYYHDLGKTDEPQYFVENLPRGHASPHDDLSPEQSAAKIIHHVRSSMVRARAAGLPEPILDFMHTHHGGGRVEFFYQRARAHATAAGEDPDQLDASAFVYPGANPDTPETGILMIVDSVEAASRTLDRADRSQLDALLRQIVFAKLAAGQLDDCGLSLRDLRRIIETLVESLLAAAHDRIAYPWQQQAKETARADAGVTEPSGVTPLSS